MTCLKGKAHEWRLVSPYPPVVACHQCGEIGTLSNLDDDAGHFYAMRDERDKLQAELKARDDRRCETCAHLGSVINCDGLWCAKRVVGRVGRPDAIGCPEWEAIENSSL